MTRDGDRKRVIQGIVVVLIAAGIWLLPPPGDLEAASIHLIAIFAATIAGLILQPLPQGAIVILGVALTAITGTLPLSGALAGYSDGTVWLIVTAFLLARGFIKTGLGRRIAFLMVERFGGSTLGLGYALTAADVIIAPATPSNTARAGGILFPVVRSLASCLGSEPGPTARRAGAFLMFNEFQTNLVTSALFLTAVAPNAMIAKLAGETLGVQITWMNWFTAAILPALISLLLLPLLVYHFLKPEVTHSDNARVHARQELKAMGAMSRDETRMLFVFMGTVGFWASSQWTGLSATAIALTGVGALLVGKVLRWDDVLAERGAWDALIWFGGLVSLAAGLGKLGVIELLAKNLEQALNGMDSWVPGFLLLILAYVYSHYFIASMTAHATALYVPLGLVALSLGTPPFLAALVLGFMNSLNAAMTTYGTGPSPIYFGSGFVDQASWWKYGLILSVINLAIWLTFGALWWKLLGLW